MVPQLRLRVVIVEEMDGGFSATCPDLEGCMTQAETLHEVKANIVEAIQLNLEHLAAIGQPLPTLPMEKSDEAGLFLPRVGAEAAPLDGTMAKNRQEFDLLLS